MSRDVRSGVTCSKGHPALLANAEDIGTPTSPTVVVLIDCGELTCPAEMAILDQSGGRS
jgi:hypothetical protein